MWSQSPDKRLRRWRGRRIARRGSRGGGMFGSRNGDEEAGAAGAEVVERSALDVAVYDLK